MSPACSRAFSSVVVALALVAQGCVYVTQSTREDKEASLDQDGDGALYGGDNPDCDDLDPQRSPLFEEIPYDGIDNDCDGFDLVDVDGDGYPGIRFEDWQPKKGAQWPAGVRQDTEVDCVDQPVEGQDWDPASIFPDTNNPAEVPYDGIDADCQGDNDFDVDNDGFLRDEDREGFEAYVRDWGYEGQIASWFPSAGRAEYGDCDDRDANAYPGDHEDQPYDGIDANCDGSNDFDADGDGFMPPKTPQGGATRDAFAEYLRKYELSIPLPDDVVASADGKILLTAFDDCLDQPVAPLTVDPATVYPRAWTPVFGANGDVPYDGIDTDCLGDNDFDQDRDGFIVDEETLADVGLLYQDYIGFWGPRWDDTRPLTPEARLLEWASVNPGVVLLEPGEGDCLDEDALTYPAALERIGDGVDQDCDGDPNSSAFSFRGAQLFPQLTWRSPGAARITRVGELYGVVVTTDVFQQRNDSTVDPEKVNVGLVLPFPVDSARSLAAPSAAPLEWRISNNIQPLAPAIDVISLPECASGGVALAYIGYQYVLSTGSNTYAGWLSLTHTPPALTFQVPSPFAVSIYPGARFQTASWTSVDDQCEPVMAGLSADSTYVARGRSPANPVGLPAMWTEEEADVMFGLRRPTSSYDLMFCTGGVCEERTYGLDGGGAMELVSTTPSAESWSRGRLHTSLDGRDVRVMLPYLGSGLVVDADDFDSPVSALDAEVVLDADAVIWDDELYVVALIDDAGARRLVLLNGSLGPTVEFAETPLGFEPPPEASGAVPEHVSIHVDDDRIGVAITALDPDADENDLRDTVGWLFLGPAL